MIWGNALYSCNLLSEIGRCKHVQLTFPFLSRGEDRIYSASCLPVNNRAIVKQVFNHSEDENVFKPVHREELIRYQAEDRLLTKVRYFLHYGWPTLAGLKQMYPTKGLLEYFYNRRCLVETPDGLLVMKRGPYDIAIEERSCIPYCLVYHVFKYCHYGLAEFHASIEQTYRGISFRYFV